jgi:hypothetical protein
VISWQQYRTLLYLYFSSRTTDYFFTSVIAA